MPAMVGKSQRTAPAAVVNCRASEIARVWNMLPMPRLTTPGATDGSRSPLNVSTASDRSGCGPRLTIAANGNQLFTVSGALTANCVARDR